MTKITTILFDLDGTIINTPKLIMESFKFAIKENSDYNLNDDEITNVLGQTLDKAFKPFANDLNHLNKMIQSFRDYSNIHGDDIKVFDGVYETLNYLKDKKYTLGIVTSKSKKIALKNLKDLNLVNYFNCVVTYEDTKLHKPNKEPLLKGLDLLGKAVEESIYIGDHENDIKAGKNALMKTGLMNYSHRLKEAKALNPNYIFDSFNSIKQLF